MNYTAHRLGIDHERGRYLWKTSIARRHFLLSSFLLSARTICLAQTVNFGEVFPRKLYDCRRPEIRDVYDSPLRDPEYEAGGFHPLSAASCRPNGSEETEHNVARHFQLFVQDRVRAAWISRELHLCAHLFELACRGFDSRPRDVGIRIAGAEQGGRTVEQSWVVEVRSRRAN
jgi:hypothetical protein